MNTYKVEEAVKIGRDHHWRFREMGRKGTLDEPLPREGWWYFPANTDTVIPRNASQEKD